MIKISCVPSLSQVSGAWDTMLVSNASEHLDVSRIKGGERKRANRFSSCIGSAPSMWPKCVERLDLGWIMQEEALTVRSGGSRSRSDGPDQRAVTKSLKNGYPFKNGFGSPVPVGYGRPVFSG